MIIKCHIMFEKQNWLGRILIRVIESLYSDCVTTKNSALNKSQILKICRF